MGHPLDGAFLRIDRAYAHLSEASRVIHEFGKACINHIVANEDINGKLRIGFRTAVPDVPNILPVIVSDAVHNMRAALDYLVYELARHDSGKIQNGTQFLIEDFKVVAARPNLGFDGKKGHCLKKLSDPHIAMIEGFQPYNGVDWTKTLRDISNPDKHRQLTAISDEGYSTISYHGSGSLRDKLPVTVPDPDEWNVDFSHAIYIAPVDLKKPALIPTLLTLHSKVNGVLILFKPEF